MTRTGHTWCGIPYVDAHSDNHYMRIIVTGGRDYHNEDRIWDTLIDYHADPPPTLVHGACRTGADAIADAIATELGWTIEPHPAQWSIHGRAAGPRRNTSMAKLGADLCISFPGGRGTAHMVDQARRHGIPVHMIT